MPALVFNTCCGCIELKTGCLIIGYLELVGEIIASILVLLLIVGGGVGLAQGGKDDGGQAVGGALLAMGVIFLLVIALLLAFTITLLVGIHKNKRGHVKAYLIYSAIFLVIAVIMFFAGLSHSVEAKNVVSNLIGLLLHAYFFLVIRSYYHKMDDSNKGAIYNTA